MYSKQSIWSIGGGGLTKGVKVLLVANGTWFILELFTGGGLTTILGLVPRLVWSRFHIWQPVTYMFLHSSFLHLALNMYALWVFGCEVERMWGTHAFLRYYFITGIGAGLIHTLVTPFSMIPTIGASGAVAGVLAAFALMFPDREITLLLFFIIPVRMKARTLALLFAGGALLNGVVGSPDGIAHFAHLGGMLVGYLYLKKGLDAKKVLKTYKTWDQKQKVKASREKEENLEKIKRMVDKVLDKANEVGFENLTRDEKLLLKKASTILKKEKNES